MSGTLECGIPGCGKKLARRFLMCAAHWALVPLVLQQAVEKTQEEWAHQAYFAKNDPPTIKMLRHNVMMARAVAIACVVDPKSLAPP
jgi:hypothetical protein